MKGSGVLTTDTMKVDDIRNIECESGVICSLLLKPELIFYSEQLKSRHFVDKTNSCIYYAIDKLVQRGVDKVDAYNITTLLLNEKESVRKISEPYITIPALNELIEVSKDVARETPEEYKMLADNVLNAAMRRETYEKLSECRRLCFNDNIDNIEQRIYSTLDDVMMSFSTASDAPQYKDVVDEYWEEIKARQNGALSGIPFKFPSLNKYATIEPGELFIFAAEQKQGKSMMLLNCMVDLIKQDYAVLYLDSELNSRLFTCRLISHLANVEFARVRSGDYSQEEASRIEEAREWLKTRNFTHVYLPMFDAQSIYTLARKTKNKHGLDVIIIDYFKSKGEGDAFATYQELGALVDMVKNKICGDMDIAGIGAAQATQAGKIADSKKIARNASTIAVIESKTPEEVEADGVECGNKKLRVLFNRNGAQMSGDEYIDLDFKGNLVRYEEARQHEEVCPY